MTKQSVFCLIASCDQAAHIIEQLKQAGFSRNDIKLLFPEQGAARDVVQEKDNAAPGGAAAIGIADGLIALDIPEPEARRYAGKLKDGNVLLSVHAEHEQGITQAGDIFTRAGAQDICVMGEADGLKTDQPHESTPPDAGVEIEFAWHPEVASYADIRG